MLRSRANVHGPRGRATRGGLEVVAVAHLQVDRFASRRDAHAKASSDERGASGMADGRASAGNVSAAGCAPDSVLRLSRRVIPETSLPIAAGHRARRAARGSCTRGSWP
jgi:hypothetical protein